MYSNGLDSYRFFIYFCILQLKVAADQPFWIWSSWISMVYPHPKLHFLFDSNGLAIWPNFPDITLFKKIMQIIYHFGCHNLVSTWILPNFELIWAISEIDLWYTFLRNTQKNCRVNHFNKKIYWSKKSQCNQVKCEIIQALVMINLYVKFIVHFNHARQLTVLKVADIHTYGQTLTDGHALWRQ